jgi:hypothetical protein
MAEHPENSSRSHQIFNTSITRRIF